MSETVKQSPNEILNSNKWKDVTQFLRDTTKNEFEEGEMVHGPGFNLFDILSATEMGDEKMDTYLNGPNKEYVFWPKDRLERGIIKPISTLSIKQILFMMDKLLCGVFTWYEGWSLIQTILTCEYVHHMGHVSEASNYNDTKNIVKYFHALASGVLLLREKLEIVMSKALCREQEEFSYDPCGLKVEPEKESVVMERLESLEKELTSRLDYLTRKTTQLTFEPIQEDATIEEAIVKALLSRISFIKNFLIVHVSMMSIISPQAGNCKKSITACFSLFVQIKDENKLLELDNHSVGFDKYIALIGNYISPLKAIEIFNIETSLEVVTNFLNEMNYILGVRQLQSLNQLLHFFRNFSLSKKQENSVVSRAFLLYTTIQDEFLFGKHKLSDWVEKHLETEIICLTEKHLQEIKKQKKNPDILYQEWIAALSHIILKILNAYCNNKSRLRRIFSNIIADLGLAEQRAEQIDVTWIGIDVNNVELVRKSDRLFSFSLFTIDFIIDIMHQILTIGFDLDIYHHTEIVQVAWYLDYITKIRSSNQAKLFTDIKKKKSGPMINLNRYQLYSRTVTEVHNLFYRGLFRFIMAMHKKGLYTNISAETDYPLTSDELRFNNRFKAFFNTMQPPPVSFESFSKANDLSFVNEKDLFDSARDHFEATQKAVDMVLKQDIKLSPYEKLSLELLLKSAKTNAVSVVVCSRAQKEEGMPQTPFFDFSISSQFPVVKPPKKK